MSKCEYEQGVPIRLRFSGDEELIRRIDESLAADATASLGTRLSEILQGLLQTQTIRLPSSVLAQTVDHYSRRELYRSERFGYCIVAMIWSPGQGTPVHDHDELWCVEGIWRGLLEITPYELLEIRDQTYRFKAAPSVLVSAGETAHLGPPHEYHVVRNPSAEEVTVSIHIYESPLQKYARFEPVGDGWYRRQQSVLEIDPSED